MLKRAVGLTMVLALVLVLGASTVGFGQDRPGRGLGRGDRSPMQGAMRALRHAQTQLEKAPPQYGGHRTKALDLIKQAQKELEAGLAFAEANKAKAGGSAAPAPATTPAPPTTAPAPSTTAPKTK